jgi:ring-1,2-phenylacetyl-CoA epoxidase subunit PaaE
MELVIADIKEEIKGVKTFFLKPADGSTLRYRAGQFLTCSLIISGREQRRSYSLSSTPGVDDMPFITIKRVENGWLSRWLVDDARVGDKLHTTDSATGLFTLPDDANAFEALWLFAAGIGITPLYALLKDLLYHTAVPRVVLLYSNRSQAQTVFFKQIEALQGQFPERLKVIHLWSNTQDLLRARISKESFPLLRKEVLTDNPHRVLCYLCGPASYMWLLELLLQDAGVPAANVRRETFVVKSEVPKRLPADKASHRVEVLMKGHTFRFTNAYPQSILSSARAAGVALPYSCDAGQCGSCTAICRKGKVWMSYNEVLTERDLEMNRVLTCTGHAVDGDVVLVFQE